MKSLLKKSVAVILMLFITASCLSVQSFALFDKITDVKIKSVETFSYKQIKEEFEFLEEMGGAETDEDYYYPLDCEAEVTISTGEVIKVDGGLGFSENEKRTLEAYAYIDIRECRKAYEEGTMKVPVYISFTLYSSIGIKLDEKKLEKKVAFREKTVKKLSLVSGEIEVYALEYSYIDTGLKGLSFDIVYGDGSKKRAKVKEVNEKMLTYYTLDGEEIYVITDYTISKNGKLYASVYFCDYELRVPVTVKEFPIKSVKINSVSFDDNFKEKKVTCTITKTNGKAYKKTYELGEPIVELAELGMAVYGGFEFEGFDITVAVYSTEGETYPVQQFKEVWVSVADVVDCSKTFEGPKQEGTKIGELVFKIVSFIKGILAKLYLA